MRAIHVLTVVGAIVPLHAATVDFQSEIRPVLSDNCFACHGPDPAARIAGFRLDVQEGALAERPNGTPIVPGDSASSLLYPRITHQEPALRMPPESSHNELTEVQIALIKRWIDEGAEWTEHWAFRPISNPDLPAIKNESWVRNSIDRFILARVEAEGLSPEPEADKRSLIRRLALDLTGLPPEPALVEEFVADASPDAYGKLIDRMMAAEAFGEHRSKYWLDAARYADTHGLHIDNYREMWPYRDWVIDAFNANMPFDRFTIEQLAGDMLPDPTQDQIVATGFQRCNITTNEGGVIDKEVEEIYAKDRAETLATVWLGLTVGCATCHDHKFDPITQRDFYELGAFFRNTVQPVRDGNVHDTPPVMLVLGGSDKDRWEALKTEIPAARRELARLAATESAKGFKQLRKPEARAEFAFEQFDESEKFSLGSMTQLPEGVSPVEGPAEDAAFLFAEDAMIEVPGVDLISSDEPFTIAAWVQSNEDARVIVASQLEYIGPEASYDERGWNLEVSAGRVTFELIGDREFELGLRSEKRRKAKAGEWHHITASYDGSRRRSGMTIYLDGNRLETESVGRVIHQLEGEIRRGRPLTVGGRLDNEGEISSPGGAISDLRILDREVNEAEAKLLASWAHLKALEGKKAPSRRSRPGRKAVERLYLAHNNEAYRRTTERLTRLEQERRGFLRRNPLTHVMTEKENSEPMAHVLYRGMYDQPGAQVGAETLSFLPPMDQDLPRNRMGLAKWLLADENPLTARVTVNRMWQEVFGTGLVRTAGDFGSQGEAPTHPELLDWLATDFRENGWDVKRFYKQLLMSAAYRQSAKVSPEKLEKDDQNRLLSRGPRFRMDGEMVRDYALASSGLINAKVGGPSVKPYQPDSVWEPIAMKQSNTRFYSRDDGDALYRRSLYTFWKRAAPPPSMLIFDAPTKENCTVRRERTNTPLQALVTMNDPQFFEAARNLAERAQKSSTEFNGRVNYMSMRLLARQLNDPEREIVQRSYREFMRHYDSTPADAKEVLTVGESRSDVADGEAVLASLTMVANQLLNLDEVLNK